MMKIKSSFQSKVRRITIRDIRYVFIENSYYILLMYLLSGEAFTKAFLGVVRSFIRVPFKADALFLYGLVALAAIYSCKYIYRTFPLKEMSLFAFLWFSLLISFGVEEGFDSLYISIAKTFFQGMMGYICFRCINDWEKTLLWLGRTSVIIVFSLFLYLSLMGGLEHYSLYLGYLLLPGVIISANEMMRKRSVVFLFVFILGVFLQISIGARGPVVCILLFLCIRLLIETGRSRYGVFLLLCISVGAFFLFRHFDDIVSILSKLYGSVNLSDRILTKFQNELFLNGGTRNVIQGHVISLIDQYPISGVGIGLDRIRVAGLMYDQFNPEGYYPHNPFLEVWLQFGIVIGSVLLFVLFRPFVRSVAKRKLQTETKDIVLIMVFTGVVPLLISSSYLTKQEFFYALAVCTAASKMKPTANRYNNTKGID